MVSKNSARITSVRFKNYKALREYLIRLSDTNFLVGPSNAGKSTIISAFRILAVGLKKIAGKRLDLVEGPNGRSYGVTIPSDALPISIENVHTDYADEDTKFGYDPDGADPVSAKLRVPDVRWSMNFRIGAICILLIASIAAIPPANAQGSEVENMFRDLEVKAAAGSTNTDQADPVMERLKQVDKEKVEEALPLILRETGSPLVPVRRIAALALYEIATRPDGRGLLSGQTATLSALIVDPDIPIRRITSLSVYTLRPDASSPLLPALETYLSRPDAVSTIGAGLATVLLLAAPEDAAATEAVVQYMRRSDQTSVSRIELMDAVTSVAKSHSRALGREVAAYADDPDDETAVTAIGTLRGMGKDVLLDSLPSLLRIAADPQRGPGVRTAATKAIAVIQ